MEATPAQGPGEELVGAGRPESLLLSHPDPVLHYLGFLPVVDGDFIPDDPMNLYANAADIDYLAGTNDMDGHMFASLDMPAINKNKQDITA